jgi:hypothetical protein
MDKTDKYIDDLFRQKFSGAGAIVPPSGGDWIQLSKVIRKKNFLRFSPGSFNVFYLTAAAAVVTTVGSFVLPEIINNDKSENINQPANTLVLDSIPNADTLTVRADSLLIIKLKSSETICNDPVSKNHRMKQEKANNSNQSAEELNGFVNDKNKIGTGDSLSIISEPNYPGDEEKINENQRFNKFAPADTIVKIDTIHIQKKGVQFKRKKDAF